MKRKILFSLSLLGFVLFTACAQDVNPPQSKEGWTPKWQVGDWWVVKLEYDASAFSPKAMILKSDPQTAVIKYSIVGEEDLNWEKVLKLEIRKINKARTLSYYDFDMLLNKNNLSVLKKYMLVRLEVFEEYTFDNPYAALSIPSSRFMQHLIPVFPLLDEKNDIHQMIKFKHKFMRDGQWEERESGQEWTGQTSEPIALADMPQDEKINKDFLRGNIYKIAVGGNEPIQYWVKDIPWWVYYEETGIKGYLKEYHVGEGQQPK